MAKRTKSKRSKNGESGVIVIDKEKKLTFKSEDEVYEHFKERIIILEEEFKSHRTESDIDFKKFVEFDSLLEKTLSRPDEVWEDSESLPGETMRYYLLLTEAHLAKPIFYVAIAYIGDRRPTFVYLHFPTIDENLLNWYRRGTKILDRAEKFGLSAAQEDALSDGDELAQGLFEAMLKIRSEKDLSLSEFSNYLDYREVTLENPDEIWRYTDSQGRVLVNFIKEFTRDELPVFYIVVTLEENLSESHFLLFSFPTRDVSLVDRYRHGESLHTEEFVREESH